MTNVNVTAEVFYPLGGGGTKKGLKMGFIDSAAKAAQNDTWTVLNATSIEAVFPLLDSTGVADAPTISGNVVTLTGAGTGASSAVIVFK